MMDNDEMAGFNRLRLASFSPYMRSKDPDRTTEVYGVIIDFPSSPYSDPTDIWPDNNEFELDQRNILTCYISGYCSLYTNHAGSLVNGLGFRKNSLALADQVYAKGYSTAFPDPKISSTAVELVYKSNGFFQLGVPSTELTRKWNFVTFYFLTRQGGAYTYKAEVKLEELEKNDTAWSPFFKEAKSIYQDLKEILIHCNFDSK